MCPLSITRKASSSRAYMRTPQGQSSTRVLVVCCIHSSSSAPPHRRHRLLHPIPLWGAQARRARAVALRFLLVERRSAAIHGSAWKGDSQNAPHPPTRNSDRLSDSYRGGPLSHRVFVMYSTVICT